MRQVQLAPNLEVSAVGFGTYHLPDRMNDELAAQALASAYNAGINLVDTSDNYMTEETVGQSLEAYPGDVVVATKTGLATTYGEHLQFLASGRRCDTSPNRVRAQLDKSLAAIATDCVDLYQIHLYDPGTEQQDLAICMDGLVESGKIKNYGLSNYNCEQLEQFLAMCDKLGLRRPATLQNFYSLVSLGIVDDSAVELAAKEGMGILASSPVAKGLLQNDFIIELTRWAVNNLPKNDLMAEQLNEVLDSISHYYTLIAYAEGRGYTLSELALAWCIRRPGFVALNACVDKQKVASANKASEWQLDQKGLDLCEQFRGNPEVRRSAAVMIEIALKSRRYYDLKKS